MRPIGVAIDEMIGEVLRLHEHLGDQRCVDEAGAVDIDANTPLRIFDGRAPGHTDLGLLGGRIA